jgi:hypothetical protein
MPGNAKYWSKRLTIWPHVLEMGLIEPERIGYNVSKRAISAGKRENMKA